MSDQEVTYSALRFPQSSSESQTRPGPDGTGRSGKTEDKEFSVSWHLIAVTLGTLCLLLSVAVIVLVTKILQLIDEKHQQQETIGNLTQMYHVVQNDDYLKQQLLANKSLEYDALKNKTLLTKNAPESSFLKQNGCCAKEDNFPKSVHNPDIWSICDHQHHCNFKNSWKMTLFNNSSGISKNRHQSKFHEDYWSCYGVNCYYFVLQDNTWEQCKQTCQRYSFSLLKIDNEHELAFVQFQIHGNIYWIGLSFNEGEWKWLDDGTSPGMYLKMMSLHYGTGKCGFLTSTRVDNIDCSKTYSCICKKRINCNFPSSMCT